MYHVRSHLSADLNPYGVEPHYAVKGFVVMNKKVHLQQRSPCTIIASTVAYISRFARLSSESADEREANAHPMIDGKLSPGIYRRYSSE
jgi:hypothetical protein